MTLIDHQNRPLTAHLNRRHFAAVSVAAATSLMLPSAFAQSKLEKTKVALAVGGKGSFYYLPLTITEQLGYFKDEGLEVEISDFAGGAKALQAVVGGSADVCSGAFEHTINMQSKNQYFRAFVMQGRTPQVAFAVSNKTMPHYKTIADLKGRKIGVSAPGSSTNMMANLLLTRGGLKPEDVSFIGVGVAAGALTALRSGQIDAICNTDPVITMLEQNGEITLISDTRTQAGTLDLYGGPMPAACLYAQDKFVQSNPNTVQALTNAVVRALQWLQTATPADVARVMPKNFQLGDPHLYMTTFGKMRESISLDGVMPELGPQTALRAVASFDTKIKSDQIALDKLFTNEFALRAKAKFKMA